MENRNTKNNMVPAVHPRYRAVYSNLYEKEQVKRRRTLGVRLLLASAVFAITILWGRQEQEYFTQMICAIEKNDAKLLHVLDWFDTLGHNWYNDESD